MDTNKPLHCSEEDNELWSYFSDVFKDREGVRPHFFLTKAQVQASLDRYLEDDRRAREEAEEELSIRNGTHKALQPSPAGFSMALAF